METNQGLLAGSIMSQSKLGPCNLGRESLRSPLRANLSFASFSRPFHEDILSIIPGHAKGSHKLYKQRIGLTLPKPL